MVTDEDVTKLLEEIIKNPDDLFPTFSEEMAGKAREELLKAFKQKQEINELHVE